MFEIEFPVLASGGYRVRVKDPITGTPKEVSFRVVNLSPERQTAVPQRAASRADCRREPREELRHRDGLANPDEIKLNPYKEPPQIKTIALWSTWLCFGLGVLLMLGEWLTRKLINLP